MASHKRSGKTFLQRLTPERSSTKLLSTSVVLAAFSYLVFLPNFGFFNTSQDRLSSFELTEPTIENGFTIDTFQVVKGTIADGEFLSDILSRNGVSLLQIDKLAKKTKEVFDVRGIRKDKQYTILKDRKTGEAKHFIYIPSVFSYVVYDLTDDPTARFVERPKETKIETASGIIESSLWNAMVGNGYSYELAARMEDALAWTIDFHHILKGDKFKLIYEQHYIQGKKVSIGQIIGAYYQNAGNDYYAIRFENDKHDGFYDLEGRSMEKAFLKAPVKYSRISSRFSGSRYHPILKRRKAHLGTDYAAPMGTPIYAVADGIVTKASRTRGNGNYVKIKHDKTYSTQYLHMQRFAKGIRSGVHVKQNQVIGYVGKTGYATGPHVCFRFWKNGRQVNHLKENLPPPEPMPEKDIPAFMLVKDKIKGQLDGISWPEKKEDETVARVSP